MNVLPAQMNCVTEANCRLGGYLVVSEKYEEEGMRKKWNNAAESWVDFVSKGKGITEMS